MKKFSLLTCLVSLLSIAGWADVNPFPAEGTHYVTFTGKADGRKNCLYNDLSQADGFTLQSNQPTTLTNAYVWRVEVSGSKITGMKNGEGQSYGMKLCSGSNPTINEIEFVSHNSAYYLKTNASGITNGHDCLNVSAGAYKNAKGTPALTTWSTSAGPNANDNHWDVTDISGYDIYNVVITADGTDAVIACKDQMAMSGGFILVQKGASVSKNDVTGASAKYSLGEVSVDAANKTINVTMQARAIKYMVYSGGVPEGAKITIGGTEIRPQVSWTEGAEYESNMGELTTANVQVTNPGNGIVWTVKVDNANYHIWVDFTQLFVPVENAADLATAPSYYIKDALNRYPYLKGSDLWHTTARSEASKFAFLCSATPGQYYIYDVTNKNYIYYTATTGSTVDKTADSKVKFQSNIPAEGGLWKFNASGNIIPATGGNHGWNFTGGNNHPLNLWDINDSNSRWVIADSNIGSLACAVTMFSKPGVEYMHKLIPEAGVTVEGLELSQEMIDAGCTFVLKDRSTKGNKYKYVHGTAPETEGVYTYKVVLSDGTKANVKLTVSNFLQAPTPGMVWVSWNWLQDKITAQNLTDMADGLVSKGLVEAGYNTLVIDDAWGTHTGVESLTYNESKFPQGMKAFVDNINAKGIKVGIYSDAATNTCGGYQNGSIGYEKQHAEMFDSWGIDFLKYDFCGGSNAPVSYKAMGDAIAAVNAKRQAENNPDPFVFNACEWGTNKPWTWGAESGSSMWRATQDAREDWCGTHGRPGVLAGSDEVRDLWMWAGVNRFNDLDMMTIGLHGLGGPSNNTANHMSNGGKITGLTDEQARSQMSIWSMMASPLSLSCDVRETPKNECNPGGGVLNPMISEADLATLTNPEIIAISQDVMGQQAEYMAELSQDTYQQAEGYSVFVKDLAEGCIALAVVNRGGTQFAGKTFKMTDIYLEEGTYNIKDVWAGTQTTATTISTGTLKPYETKVFVVSPLNTPTSINSAESGAKSKSYYDLSGRPVNKSSRTGIYVTDGGKVSY